MNSFNRNLRVAMAARNASQGDLAEAAGVSRAFVSMLMLGQKMPSSARLMAIARFLDVSLDYLMGADDVEGQIDDVLRSRPVRKTARQIHEEAN